MGIVGSYQVDETTYPLGISGSKPKYLIQSLKHHGFIFEYSLNSLLKVLSRPLGWILMSFQDSKDNTIRKYLLINSHKQPVAMFSEKLTYGLISEDNYTLDVFNNGWYSSEFKNMDIPFTIPLQNFILYQDGPIQIDTSTTHGRLWRYIEDFNDDYDRYLRDYYTNTFELNDFRKNLRRRYEEIMEYAHSPIEMGGIFDEFGNILYREFANYNKYLSYPPMFNNVEFYKFCIDEYVAIRKMPSGLDKHCRYEDFIKFLKQLYVYKFIKLSPNLFERSVTDLDEYLAMLPASPEGLFEIIPKHYNDVFRLYGRIFDLYRDAFVNLEKRDALLVLIGDHIYELPELIKFTSF